MIHVVDDFFSNPYQIRNIALKSEYSKDPFNRWPGFRTVAMSPVLKQLVLEKVRKIVDNPKLEIDWDGTEDDIFFQYIPKNYKYGVTHVDSSLWTAVIYLNLDAPPDTGTEVHEDTIEFDKLAQTRLFKKSIELKEYFYQNPNSNGFTWNRVSKKMNSQLSPSYTVANKFNRLVLFKGVLPHRAQNFFGETVENSRLTVVSFFK